MVISRRKHSREFKVDSVKQEVEKGRSVREVAAGLGINAHLLTRWKFEFEADGTVAFALSAFVVATVA